MTEEKTKALLLEYLPLKKENDNRRERLARMKASTELPPAREYDGSQRTGSSGDRIGRGVAQYIEYEAEIRPYIKANEQRMQTIRAMISALPDPMEREVLRLRYTDSDTYRPLGWREVAFNLYGDDDSAQTQACARLHKKALAHLSQHITEAPQ